MNYTKQVLTGLIIIMVAVVIAYKFFPKGELKNNTQPLAEEQTEEQGFTAQTSSEGSVEITVRPMNLTANTWDFEVTLNTHSVELNEDLVKASILIVDGKEYKPVSWEGDPVGGHHREGILKFDAPSSQLKSTTLKINQVGGIKERRFSW